MNVYFEDGKTIIDGIPDILYFNESGRGVGSLFRRTEKLQNIINLKIEANSDTCLRSALKLTIETYEARKNK